MKETYFGKKVLLRYELTAPMGYEFCFIGKVYKLLESIIIFESEKEMAIPHEAGQTIYFPDLEKDIKVSRVSTNVNGGYVYWMDHTVEVVENEETKESLKEAEEKLAEIEKAKSEYESRVEKYYTPAERRKQKESWLARLFS